MFLKYNRMNWSAMLCAILLILVYPVFLSCSKDNGTTDVPGDQDDNKKIIADMVVAADGSGNYRTVQEAIDAAPNNRKTNFYIFIKKGVYKEVVTIPKNKDYIYLYGEDAQSTVLTFDNYAKRLRPDGTEYGTGGSSSFFVNGNYFVAENLSIANTAGIDAGQAVAINIGGAKSSFRNCRFLGHQDTWYAGNGTVQYLKNCYIEGSVDFIFGGSTAFFDACDLVSTRGGYITAASTPATQAFGYVFNTCNITALAGVNNGSVYLGRPWRPDAKVVYLQCTLGAHIHPAGWHNWGNTDNERTAYYAEFQSNGAGSSPSTRVAWSKQLTENQADNFSLNKVIGGQHPGFVAEDVVILPK